MLNILKNAQQQFREVQSLLVQPDGNNNDYFTQLSIATEEAYFVMNSGMCANTTVCENCMQHRDFIRNMMDVLGELEINSDKAEKHTNVLKEYTTRVNMILERISTVLS